MGGKAIFVLRFSVAWSVRTERKLPRCFPILERKKKDLFSHHHYASTDDTIIRQFRKSMNETASSESISFLSSSKSAATPLLKRKANGEFEDWGVYTPVMKASSLLDSARPTKEKRKVKPEDTGSSIGAGSVDILPLVQHRDYHRPVRLVLQSEHEKSSPKIMKILGPVLTTGSGSSMAITYPAPLTSQAKAPPKAAATPDIRMALGAATPQKAPSKAKIPRQPKPKPEKRSAIFKKKCPQNILDRLDRVIEQRERDGDELKETFRVLGSTGNVYTVVIGHTPRCDCPDASKGNYCKHIIFVFIKVSKLLGKRLPRDSNKTNSNRRMPKEEDDCPICYDKMHTEPESKLTWCKNLGKNVTCVWCRAEWVLPNVGKGKGKAIGDEGLSWSEKREQTWLSEVWDVSLAIVRMGRTRQKARALCAIVFVTYPELFEQPIWQEHMGFHGFDGTNVHHIENEDLPHIKKFLQYIKDLSTEDAIAAVNSLTDDSHSQGRNAYTEWWMASGFAQRLNESLKRGLARANVDIKAMYRFAAKKTKFVTVGQFALKEVEIAEAMFGSAYEDRESGSARLELRTLLHFLLTEHLNARHKDQQKAVALKTAAKKKVDAAWKAFDNPDSSINAKQAKKILLALEKYERSISGWEATDAEIQEWAEHERMKGLFEKVLVKAETNEKELKRRKKSTQFITGRLSGSNLAITASEKDIDSLQKEFTSRLESIEDSR
ncbi:uncharacterized protein EV420DRAFT_1745806 [Desarmillaria tabescens]|uniref:SWIM-type domain-containing protein n=1 Tax=Armillaria tabescens TaxID=1929756 RepID=A0AA39NB48_ARMTA|nr:uncharacterized protein EV420DRAFT_1745806 [Desarmillaria tabescens]KAK0462385.1 hypothetical protein EV420DRAFT_1745806 [Desarmillaria tabescens]